MKQTPNPGLTPGPGPGPVSEDAQADAVALVAVPCTLVYVTSGVHAGAFTAPDAATPLAFVAIAVEIGAPGRGTGRTITQWM